MSYLYNISLTQFRNYSFKQFQFPKKIIAIVGKNGSGKTNLLDSIYYLIFTKSYFQNKEINNIQNGKDGFRIEGCIGNFDKKHSVIIKLADRKKTVTQDAYIFEKINQYIGNFHAVMIAPEDLKIILDAAQYRRKFIDGTIAQLDTHHLEALLNYQKFLLQKNAYLKFLIEQKMEPDYNLLQIYNDELSNNGRIIINNRRMIINELAAKISYYYNKISDNDEHIGIQYQPNVAAEVLDKVMQSNINKELAAGISINGPHLDEILFLLNKAPFKTQASQGQKKSLVIAIKIAQIEMLSEKGLKPILLLDDIFEKLDSNRLTHFFELIMNFEIPQIILTHTSKEEVQEKLETVTRDISFIEL